MKSDEMFRKKKEGECYKRMTLLFASQLSIYQSSMQRVFCFVQRISGTGTYLRREDVGTKNNTQN